MSILIPGNEASMEGSWIEMDGQVVGLHLHHPYVELADGKWPACAGGGYVAWVAKEGIVVRHQLVAGGPDDLEALTLSPSLWHRAKDQQDPKNPLHQNGSRNSPHPECHGFVREGRWVVAR